LRPRDFKLAERCLGRLATVARQQWRIGDAREPGAGAAGGLVSALRASSVRG